MAALVAAWHWTPLHDYVEPRDIARQIRSLANSPWMAPAVGAIYVVASLVMFPNTVLCFAVIMALGPLAGAAYAYGGSLTAALVGYTIGRWGGQGVKKLRFSGFDKISAQLRNGGFMQVLMLRVLPLAPFTATNVLSGAARVSLLPYVAATLVGISPYILMFSLFGRQARRLLTHPTSTDAAIMFGVAVLAAGAIWLAHSRAAARAK